MTPWIGGALLVSWLVCWYFFFGQPQRASQKTKTNAAFAFSTALVALLLFFWVYLMWSQPPHQIPGWVLFVGAIFTVLGQWLMCEARRELPLSNYQMIMRISGATRRSGVYKHLAHPMYIGLVFALLGSALILGNRGAIGALLILVPVLIARAWIESRA